MLYWSDNEVFRQGINGLTMKLQWLRYYFHISTYSALKFSLILPSPSFCTNLIVDFHIPVIGIGKAFISCFCLSLFSSNPYHDGFSCFSCRFQLRTPYTR
mmetsp:Transcript_40346/g.108249  ORF Transcript_40346/g.108249 Transcript_40346/m.108249 type:complete len:100 (-) Transcript_40346:1404-1703(-)